MNPVTITNTAAALSDITRLRLLLALHDGGLAVGELANVLAVVPSVVSFHVGKLVDAGLVTTTRKGRRTVVRREHGRWHQVMSAFG